MDHPAAFPPDRTPAIEEFQSWTASPFWDELLTFLAEAYGAAPLVEYSRCSLAPGWNVKYRKGGRALCTLYPEPGCFTCLVVIGRRETPMAELLLPKLNPYVQNVYREASVLSGSRWLMLRVTDPAILSDVKELIALRRKPRAPS